MPPKKCGSCEKTVYPVEEFKCLDKIWHKACFKCAVCNMTLNMKNYKGYDKIPYCNAHYPETKFTAVADTPESKRLAQNSKLQSQVKYHEDFEKAKGQYTSVADDPETMRVKKNMQTISNVAYHGVLENKETMENTRPNEYEPSYDQYRNPSSQQAPPTNYNPAPRSNPQPSYQPEMRQPPQQHTDERSSGYGQRTSGYDQRSPGYDQRSSGGYDRSSSGYQQQSSMYTPMPGLAQQQPPRQMYPSQPQVPQASLQMRMQPPQQARQPPQSNMQPQMHQPPQHQMQPQMQRGPPMNQPPMRAPQPAAPRDPYQGKGKVSKAVYDYNAADADEVSFAENDLIIKCEPIDDGWMVGTVERTGQQGMLPSNYVENVNW